MAINFLMPLLTNCNKIFIDSYKSLIFDRENFAAILEIDKLGTWGFRELFEFFFLLYLNADLMGHYWLVLASIG